MGVRRGPKKTSAAEGGTRTERAGQFVAAACREAPGARTRAARLYAAYLRWCRGHEPDAPLSRSACDHVVERWAPLEGRLTERGPRGRLRLVYVGVKLRRSVP